MNYLTLDEIVELHNDALAEHGGLPGIRDEGALSSAAAQPSMAVFGAEQYADIVSKAAALCFSLIKNHCFVDGNKRIGLAALSTFLRKNGYILQATNTGAVQIILQVADSTVSREDLEDWIAEHLATLT